MDELATYSCSILYSFMSEFQSNFETTSLILKLLDVICFLEDWMHRWSHSSYFILICLEF